MTNEIELSAAEQTLCDRLVSIAIMTAERALREYALPVTQDRKRRTSQAIADAALKLILLLRDEADGMSQAAQDKWLGGLVQSVLREVWDFEVRPQQPQTLN